MQTKDPGEFDFPDDVICSLEWIAWAIDAARRHSEPRIVDERVNVQVDFPKGIISQYYPKAISYAPYYDEINTLGPSHFEWDVRLAAPNDGVGMPLTQATAFGILLETSVPI